VSQLDDLRKLYQVYLLDGSRNIVAQIKQWLPPLSVALNYNDVSAFSFAVPTEALAQLQPNGGVLITRNGFDLIHGPITSVLDQRDFANPDGLITLSGRSDEIMLTDRVCYPAPASAFTAQTNGALDTQTGAAETVIKHYVNMNAGPGALAARQTAGLTIEADSARGASVTANAQFDVLLTLIQPLANGATLGFRIARSGTGRIFQVFAPRDLHATVRFGLLLRNMTQLSDQQDAPAATRELVGGGTAPTTKAFSEVADTGSEATFGRRIEKYTSDASTTVLATLTQEGTTALITDGPQEQLAFQAIDTGAAMYGRDYLLGDKITVIKASGEIADILGGVLFDVQPGSAETLTLTIGPPGSTGTRPNSFRAIQTLDSFIRNFATRR
jgi:hypothetical protein